VAQGVPGRSKSRIFFIFGTTKVVVLQPYIRIAFTPGEKREINPHIGREIAGGGGGEGVGAKRSPRVAESKGRHLGGKISRLQ
jgi:hypothetical protein